MDWYVVYTKPKWEKKVAERLNEMGVTSYCPLVAKISQWSDRKKKIEIPLFNSYIFVKVEEEKRNVIFDIIGVVRYLFWLGKPAIVKDNEIRIIKDWLSLQGRFEVIVDEWKKGDKVVLDSGPFVSHSAVVKEIKLNHYVLVLESLGCVLKLEKKEN
jgi:transcriptional antiterminator RfaH